MMRQVWVGVVLCGAAVAACAQPPKVEVEVENASRTANARTAASTADLRAVWTAYERAAIETALKGSIKDRFSASGLDIAIEELLRLRAADPTAMHPRELQRLFEAGVQRLPKTEREVVPARTVAQWFAFRADDLVTMMYMAWAQNEWFAQDSFSDLATVVLSSVRSGAPAHIVAEAGSVALASESQAPNLADLRNDLRELVVAKWIEALGGPVPAPDIERYLVRVFERSINAKLPAELVAKIAEGVRDSADCSAWMKSYVAAINERTQAWSIRGGGFARDVTPHAMQKFEERLNQARIHAEEAWRLDPKRPESAVVLIGISRALGGDPAEWYERGTAVAPDWIPLHETYMLAMTPQWGGSTREMVEIVRKVVEAAGGGDDRVFFGVRGMRIIGQGTGVYASPDIAVKIWPACDRALRRAATDPAWADRRAYVRAAHAVHAWKAGEMDALAGFFAEKDAAMARRPFDDLELYPEDMRRDAAWALPGLPEEIATPGRSTNASALAEAFAKHEARIPPAIVEHVRWAVRDVGVRMAIQNAVTGDSWFAVPFEPGLPGMRSRAGEYAVTAATGRAPKPTASQTTTLQFAAELGERWQIKFRVAGFSKDKTAAPGAIGLGLSVGRDAQGREVMAAVSVLQSRVWLGNLESYALSATTKGERDVVVSFWDGEMAIEVDGRVIYAGKPPFRNFKASTAAIRNYAVTLPSTPFEMSDVAIRGLPQKPEVFAARRTPAR